MAAVSNYELSLADHPMKDNTGKELLANRQQANASKELLDRYLQSPLYNVLPLPEPDIFYGNPIQYPIWLQSFKAIVEGHVKEPSYRLYYLGRYTSGEAKESI